MAKSQQNALDLTVFERVDFARWRADVEAQLGGTNRFSRLRSRLDADIVLDPLYVERPAFDAGAPGAPPYVRGGSADNTSGWTAAQRIEARGDKTKLAVADELAAGARALWLDEALCFDAAQLATALVEVDVQRVALYVDAGADPMRALGNLREALGSRAADARGVIGADPLAALAREGGSAEAIDRAGELLGDVLRAAQSDLPAMRTALVSTAAYHDAGAHAVQELGIALSVGVAYLRALVDGAGLDVDRAAGRIAFSLCVGRDVFVELSKLRALRRLWARVVQASGGSAAAQRAHVHARSAWRTRATRDPWVNMLRAVSECFAAAVGGADAITIAPYNDDEADADTDGALGRRVARNVHVILAEESSLGHVLDPAGGSYYVETLSEELAQRGWAELARLEAAGGVSALLASGQLARDLGATAEARAHAVATRAHAITGVSEFANLGEAPREPQGEATGGEAAARGASAAIDIAALPRRREGDDFEALRAASDRYLAQHGARPAVLLATLGPLREHNARVGFARALFAAGGLQAQVAAPSTADADDVSTAVEALAKQPARVVCICGSDEAYAERAAELARALRGAGAALVVLAGRAPRDETLAAAFADAGVGLYIHLGCDVVAALRRTHDVALAREQSA
ncbi:MAG: methylmalonyl-CoA mutase [Myxococcales bacterium]|nr:methylmalonyl-CoA mutase [Myxococcales bacterium]